MRGFIAFILGVFGIFFVENISQGEKRDQIGNLIRHITTKPTLYFQEKECMVVKSTGYSSDHYSINVPKWRDGLTSTLAKADRGAVAVDPSVIPFGSVLWIEDYGYGIALDRGSAIRGYEIDLYFPTREEALEWGVREVVVCIVGRVDVKVVRRVVEDF